MEDKVKEIVERLYNIKIDEVVVGKDFYILYDFNNVTYIWTKYSRDEKDLEELLPILNELYNLGRGVHLIIPTKERKYLVNVDNSIYVLLEVKGLLTEKFSIYDILIDNDRYAVKDEIKAKYQNNWAELWSRKIDYYEYQIRELGNGKEEIIKSFSYFVGLAENAIAYVNMAFNDNENLKEVGNIVLAHRRVSYPNMKINYYNPLSFIIDYEVRDVGGFVKSAFWAGVDALDILENFLKYRRINSLEAKLLYARILYPSYYFDVYEDDMIDNEEIDKVVEITSNIPELENFLVDAYYLINKYVTIPPIDWLIKKEL